MQSSAPACSSLFRCRWPTFRFYWCWKPTKAAASNLFHLCVQDRKSCLYPHDKICIWPTYINTNWEMNYARTDCDRKMLTPHKLNLLASSVHLCIWDIYYFVNQIKNCNKCSGHNWPRIRIMHSIGLYRKKTIENVYFEVRSKGVVTSAPLH